MLSAAIHADPQDFLLYDLRAACCLHTHQAEQALDDAMLCTKLNPDWCRQCRPEGGA